MSKVALSLHDGEEIQGELATSSECDFTKNTWTFELRPDTQVGAGDYVLISCADLQDLAARRAQKRPL